MNYRIPIVKIDASSVFGKKRRRKKRQSYDNDDEAADEFANFGNFIEDTIDIPMDPSVEFYPNPYCKLMEGI
jgi:hypothetical protein